MVLIAAEAATIVGWECGFAVADARIDGLRSSLTLEVAQVRT